MAYESRLNVCLSGLLCRMGITSHSEVIYKGRQDILVYFQGLAIVLEGSYTKDDAEADAKKRIEQLSADVAIAVFYPPNFKQGLNEAQIMKMFESSILSVKPIVPEDYSDTLFAMLEPRPAKQPGDWFDVDLNGLATLIKEVGLFVISEAAVKKTEDEVSLLVQEFVASLSSHNESDVIARNLYDVLYKLYGFSIGDPVAIKEAVFAQAALAILLSAIYYESVRHANKLDSLSDLASQSSPQHGLEEATGRILAIDYEPIFEATKAMLKAFPAMPRIFKNLVNLASAIASKRTLLRRDFAGKVYHKVVGEWSLRKGLATYFTEVPAAYLLLHLAEPTLSSVGDFASGSGTLVVASYSAANTRYRLDLLRKGIDRDPAQIERAFHAKFMRTCRAFDVLEYAAQITALNLAFQSPTTPVSHFGVFALPFGFRKEDHATSLGSLELIRKQTDVWHKQRRMTRVGMRGKEKRRLAELEDMEHLDLIVMNPPFTRTTGRGGRAGGGLFGFMSDASAKEAVKSDYEALREEVSSALMDTAATLLRGSDLKDLLTDSEYRPYTSVWQAGEGLPFLYLADAKLKVGGKLCFVLPKSLLGGTSWFLARTMLAAKYHIEYIVVSFDPGGGSNFSHSTSLSECLIVAKKVDRHAANEETAIVIVTRKPATSIAAIALANSLKLSSKSKECEMVVAGDASALLLHVTRHDLLAYTDNWGRFAFLPHAGLLGCTKDLLSGTIAIGSLRRKVPVVRLNSIVASIGVDRHRFADTFRVVNEDLPGASRMLHGGEEELRMSMAVSANAYLLPTRDNGRELVKMKAGRLLVPDRIRMDTAHVVSMMCDEPVLSNIFYALKLKSGNVDALKALCLWLNTTWGILTVLANRTETEGGWISLKQSHWRLLPVLDVTRLHEHKVQALAGVFDRFKGVGLPRLPEQYGVGAKVSKLRLELDSAFLKGLRIAAPEDALLALYEDVGEALGQWLGARGRTPEHDALLDLG